MANEQKDQETLERARRYRAAAKTLGLSLERLARRLDISLSTSNRYANGTTPVPSHILELLDRWIAEEVKRGASRKKSGAALVAEPRGAYRAKPKKKRGA